jgi:hypothetical protein
LYGKRQAFAHNIRFHLPLEHSADAFFDGEELSLT